jgi:hypothetical protein
VVDTPELHAVAISRATSDDGNQLQRFAGKRRDEFELHLLTFFQLGEGVQGQTSFAQIMSSALEGRPFRCVPGGHTHGEVHFESWSLPFGRLAKSGLHAGKLGPHRPKYEEDTFGNQCTFVTGPTLVFPNWGLCSHGSTIVALSQYCNYPDQDQYHAQNHLNGQPFAAKQPPE